MVMWPAAPNSCPFASDSQQQLVIRAKRLVDLPGIEPGTPLLGPQGYPHQQSERSSASMKHRLTNGEVIARSKQL